MNPTPTSAPAAARLETKSAGGAADPVAAVASLITKQGDDFGRRLSVLEAKTRLDERRQKALAAEREAAEEQDREVKKGRSDPLAEQKKRNAGADVDNLEVEVKKLRLENERLTRKSARPPMPGKSGDGYSSKSLAFAKYRQAANLYLKFGQETFDGVPLRVLEQKAMHGETGTEGGFLIHPEHDQGPLERLLKEYVPMRQYATVRTISAASLKKPVSIGFASASWVGEQEARPETGTPSLVELEFPAHELYASPKLSQQLIEDASVDIEAWISEEVVDAFGEKESLGFVSGTGVKQPQGLLVPSGGWVDEGSTAWTWGSGNLGFIKTGASGAFATASTSANQGDKLWTLTSQLRAPYRQNAAFMMNRRTKGVCRTLKDGEGRWIWADARDGNPETLCGYPVVEAEQMPDIAANSYSIVFGDYRRAYTIVDRVGMSVLRDPYSAKPYVMFYTRKRVGGGIQNYEAYKALKFAA